MSKVNNRMNETNCEIQILREFLRQLTKVLAEQGIKSPNILEIRKDVRKKFYDEDYDAFPNEDNPCPKCGSCNTKTFTYDYGWEYKCLDCTHKWEDGEL